MKRMRRLRLWALILVLCLALIFSLSLGYILISAGHHCTDAHCPVCEHMAACLHAMLHFCAEELLWVLTIALALRAARLRITARFFDIVRMTPVLRHSRIDC